MFKDKCPICEGSKRLVLNTGVEIECPRCRCEAAQAEIPAHTCKVIDLFTRKVLHEYIERKAS